MTIEEQLEEYKRKKQRQREHDKYIREKAIADALLDEADKQMLKTARQLVCQVYERHSNQELRYVRERVRRIETIIKRLDFLLKEDGNAD